MVAKLLITVATQVWTSLFHTTASLLLIL